MGSPSTSNKSSSSAISAFRTDHSGAPPSTISTGRPSRGPFARWGRGARRRGRASRKEGAHRGNALERAGRGEAESVFVEPEEGKRITLQSFPEPFQTTGGDIAGNLRGIGQRVTDSRASGNHELRRRSRFPRRLSRCVSFASLESSGERQHRALSRAGSPFAVGARQHCICVLRPANRGRTAPPAPRRKRV